jgi:hypothetical protein
LSRLGRITKNLLDISTLKGRRRRSGRRRRRPKRRQRRRPTIRQCPNLEEVVLQEWSKASSSF